MIPASFRYAAPRSVAEAVDLLHGNEDAKVLAGGHSLLPLMKLRLANPPVLVDINRIAGLDYIREDPQMGRLRIGALARHVDFERSDLIRQRYPMLWDAARGMAIRWCATGAPWRVPWLTPIRPPTGQPRCSRPKA